jgi:hypothetical protein
MWNRAEAGEIPTEPINPGRPHRRYADTPKLRQWCGSKLVALAVKKKGSRRLRPGPFARISNSLLRANSDLHKIDAQLQLKARPIFELEALSAVCEFVGNFKIKVDAAIKAARSRGEMNDLL